MTTSPPIDWPTGGFEWTDELRAKLPIIRGIRVTDPKPPTGAWTKPPHLLTEPPSGYYGYWIKNYLDSRAKRGLPPAAKLWTESEAQARLSADALRSSDWEYWQELVLQIFYKQGSCADFRWALEAALELHGPVFATRWLLYLAQEFKYMPLGKDDHDQLREVLASSSEDDYRAALRVAAGYRGQSDVLDLITSYLFPDQTDWAEQSAVHRIPYHWEYMLDHLILSVEVAKKDGYDSRIWEEISPSAALLHIYRQGEAALPILAVMFDRQHSASRKLAFLSLIVQLRTPGIIPAMVTRFDNKQARAALDKLAERWPAACLVSALERAATGRFDELDGWITRLALRQPQAVEPALAACSPEARARGADLVKPQSAPEEASAEALPEVLRNPPWTSKDRPKPLPVLWIVPAKPPKLPAFFVPAAFHRPRLNGGGALPLASVAHLGTMLAISRLDEPYAGLAHVKAACTSDSLSNFAWDVFEAWLAAGAPSKEDWAFTALALLGDDETARRLTPLLAQWSRHGAHARATTGLDVLVTIGTDVAMQRLSTLVDNKAASEQLRDKARQRLADVAQERGLSEEELADWLVPDLELNANGTLTLDFGPRQFMVGFDEALRPWVQDAAGVQLKTLPKPIQSDDPDAARAATQRFNALEKDAKAIAKQHIERLAKAMTSRRRWTPASFRMLFMEHPVMCHLARRLVWGVYRDGELVEAFRVAEDSSLADRHDNTYALPDAGTIGLVMAAELSEELYRAFGQIFADYEIIQPFKQLGRELYRPNKSEQKSGEVTRFVGKKVHGGSLNALANRGWRQERQNHGPVFCKPVGGGLTVVLQAQALNSHSGSEWGEPDHAFGKLFVRRDGSDARVAVTELTPLAFSEAMRDVALLPVLKPQ